MREKERGAEQALDFVHWFALTTEGVIVPLPQQFTLEKIYPIPKGMRRQMSMNRRDLLEIGIGQLRVVGNKIVIERSAMKSHVGVIVFVIEQPKSDLEVLRTFRTVLPTFEDMSAKGALARADETGYVGSLILVGREPFLVIKDPVSKGGKPPGLFRRSSIRTGQLFRWVFHDKIENRAQGVYLLLANHLEASLRLHAAQHGFAAYRRARGDPGTHLRRIS